MYVVGSNELIIMGKIYDLNSVTKKSGNFSVINACEMD